MPFVRIGVSDSLTQAQRRTIADGVHQGSVDAIQIPPDDRFLLIDAYDSGSLLADPHYLGISRTGRMVFVQIFLDVPHGTDEANPLSAHHGIVASECADPTRGCLHHFG
jgi:hypothetical protein